MTQLIDASGVVVFEGEIVGGGFTVLHVPLAFDTPGFLLTGVPVWTPAVGDWLVGAFFTIPIDGFQDAGNTVTPFLYLGHLGALDDLCAGGVGVLNGPWDIQDSDTGVGAHMARAINGQFIVPRLLPTASVQGLRALDTAPVYAMYDDGSGGDPVCVQGEGELVLTILNA